MDGAGAPEPAAGSEEAARVLGAVPGDLAAAVTIFAVVVHGRSGLARAGRASLPPAGLALDYELVGGGDEPVDRGLGQQRVGHHGQPFRGGG